MVKKKTPAKRLRNFVFGLLSFFLSLSLFLLSMCTVLEASVFNKNLWLDSMHLSDYFTDKAEELKKDLTDLGYATGLNEDFFERVIDTLMITTDTQDYIDNYFEGESDTIDTTGFAQLFCDELDKYIEETNAVVADDKSKDYLVKEAASIYRLNLEVPVIKRISVQFLAFKKYMPFILGGLALISLILVLVMVFCNKWKHRAAKYLCYATSGAFLPTLTVAVFLTINGGLSKINLSSRAVYNMAVHFGNSINIALWLCVLIFLLLSVGLYIWYRQQYIKVAADD